MKNQEAIIQSIHQIAQQAANNKIAHLSTEDDFFEHNRIKINSVNAVNFGSCSYLGLEFDERLKRAAQEAIDKYGTQFSCSRAYVSLGLYDELEALLSKIFQDNYALVTPTTTLGHIATIPVVVDNKDVVILDHQVHRSVQGAVDLLKAKGVRVEMIRHNNMEMLERKIKELRNKHNNIWYMADGIYSMYGDGTPVKKIHELMDKYPQLHFYVDDAHGMSCYGPNGAGYVLEQAPMHPRQIIAVSLAKAFATGGSVMVFPNKEVRERVRSCGGPMITSGPLQPANLGAAIASAKIHLSDEIEELKEDLSENIKYAYLMLKKHGLPVIHGSNSPVFFVGVSLPKVGNRVIQKMLEKGHYLNLGIFPAVPLKNTGIRFTITRLHTFEQIENMIDDLAKCYHTTLLEEGVEIEKIYKAFKMKMPEKINSNEKIERLLQSTSLITQTAKSIEQIDKKEWDSFFSGKGTFDYEGLRFLEHNFKNNNNAANNWHFDYLTIRNQSDKVVLATFFTTALSKDDMLASQDISEKVEQLRAKEGDDFLTSKTVMMGSMLTEGNHLFLNKNLPEWKAALEEMFSFASTLQDNYEANTIMYRDFVEANNEIDAFFMENGFVKTELPTTNVIENQSFANTNEWLQNLSAKSRRHVRKNVLKNETHFEIKTVRNASAKKATHWYSLYTQVKNNSLLINSFALPERMFHNISKAPQWEVIELHLKQNEITETSAVAVIFNYKSGDAYTAMFIGIDYTHQENYMPYRQALYQTIKKASSEDFKRIHLGFTADFEKKRLGATPKKCFGYMQLKDHYNYSVIQNIAVQSA